MALFDWLFRRDPEATPTGRSKYHSSNGSESWNRTMVSPTRDTLSHVNKVPTGDFRFIALDVETANSDAASICQIGLACVQSDNEIQTFSMFVNPGTGFDHFNIQLHGIGPATVADALRFPCALNAILPLLAGHHLIQHSSFDKRAMAAACRFSGVPVPDLRWSDSVAIARRSWPEFRGNGGHGLAHLKRALNLQFQHHDAGEDARASAMVVLQAEAHLSMTLEELVIPEPRRRNGATLTPTPNPDCSLAGAVAVFTGKLGMSRDEAAVWAARAGMTVKGGVQKQTTHLIVGDQDLSSLAGHTKSSKHRKAQEMRDAGHPIQILGEAEFMGLMKSVDAAL